MEELDLLKKDWQKANVFEQISEMEIYKMLHKKSSSIVKWILIISILEFLFWNVFSILFLGDNYIKEKVGNEISGCIIKINFIYNIINYVVIVLFIYLFYKNYKEICVTSSTKKLMNNILKTRKTVNYYVWYNLLFFVFGTLVVFYVQISCDSRFHQLFEATDTNSNFVLLKIIGTGLAILLSFVLLFWLFYKILYGILLKKLNRNYAELKKMDL